MDELDYDWDDLYTAEEFCEYARGGYSYWVEHVGECETQYRSECAMFGDAGPGQGLRLSELKWNLRQVEETYKRLTGDDLASVAYPLYWENEDV